MATIVWLFLLGGVALLIPTAYAGKIGAPFAPTRIRVVRKAFDILKIDSDDCLVDLGAGDGKIMREAAARGAAAYGYELSPIVWVVAWLRTLGKGKVLYGNFFKAKLPKETTIVFSFLMPQNMQKVRQFVAGQDLPQGQYFLSYAFPVPDLDPELVVREDNCAPLYVYNLASFRVPPQGESGI